MNQKYIVVAGNYDQFRDFKIKKIQELWESGIFVESTDFIYATEDSIRGHRNPKGWFWGTWRDRKDIDVIITLLRLAQGNLNETLIRLHREVRYEKEKG